MPELFRLNIVFDPCVHFSMSSVSKLHFCISCLPLVRLASDIPVQVSNCFSVRVPSVWISFL